MPKRAVNCVLGTLLSTASLFGASLAPGIVVSAPAAQTNQNLSGQWGVLALFPGRYWMLIGSNPELYVQYQWEEPNSILTFTGLDHSGKLITGNYVLDHDSGNIGGITMYGGVTAQSTVQLIANGFVESGLQGKVQVRETHIRTGPASFTITSEIYQQGQWKLVGVKTYALVTAASVAALGWTPQAPGGSPSNPTALQGIGQAMKQGALQGLADGVHDGVQARVRGTVAPGAYPNGAPTQVVQQPMYPPPQTLQPTACPAGYYCGQDAARSGGASDPYQRTYQPSTLPPGAPPSSRCPNFRMDC